MKVTSQTDSSVSTPITRAEMEGEQEVVSKEVGRKRRYSRRISLEEEDLIHRLHRLLGDRWLMISERLPDRSAEEVERYWKEIERKKYRETKLFKPKCSKPSSSFKFRMEGTFDNGIEEEVSSLLLSKLPVHVLKDDDSTFTIG